MGWENVLGCMFSSLFTQHEVAKGSISTTSLQKDKSNSVVVICFCYLSFIMSQLLLLRTVV